MTDKLTVPKDDLDRKIEEAKKRYRRLDKLASRLMQRGDDIAPGPYREELQDLAAELGKETARLDTLLWIRGENPVAYREREVSLIDYLRDVVGSILPPSGRTDSGEESVERKKIRFDEV